MDEFEEVLEGGVLDAAAAPAEAAVPGPEGVEGADCEVLAPPAPVPGK